MSVPPMIAIPIVTNQTTLKGAMAPTATYAMECAAVAMNTIVAPPSIVSSMPMNGYLAPVSAAPYIPGEPRLPGTMTPLAEMSAP